MAEIRFRLNGKEVSAVAEEGRPLLEVIREDLKLTGTKYGCGEGQCRACTILVNGEPSISCRMSLADVEGAEVITIEGIAGASLHPVQEAFIDEAAMQCGYCVPGMVLQTIALLQKNPAPTDEQIVDALNGNLCRCCNYANILRAVKRAVTMMEASA